MPLSSRFRSLRRWAASILAAVLLVALASWLLLPRWLAGPGMRMASEALGRTVSVEQVRFQPWRLRLQVEGLRIAGRQAADPPLLTVARAETVVSLRSLWHLAPVLSELSIDQPVLRLARLSDGHYDIDDLLSRFAAKPSEPPAGDDAPARFGLYNIRLDGGQVLLDDRPVGRQHALSELRLALPFLSTLAADVSIVVRPALEGRLNGVAFGSAAQLMPFADDPKAQLTLRIEGLDLAPYLGYQPREQPLRVQRGRLDARLDLHFDQAPKQAPQLRLGGELLLGDFALQTPAGERWLDGRALRVALRDVQPLRRQVRLGAIDLDGLTLALSSDAAGRLWLPGAGAAAAGSPASGPAPVAPWSIGFERLALKEARIDWQDGAQPRPAVLHAGALQLEVGAFVWPIEAGRPATPVHWQVQLAAGKGKAGTLKGEANLSAAQLSLKTDWQDLTLADFAPWLQAHAPVVLVGQFSGRAGFELQRPLDAEPMQRAALTLQDLRIAGLALTPAAASATTPAALTAAALRLDDASIEPGAQRLRAGELTIDRPVVQAQRNAEGRWNHEAMLPAAPAAPAASGASAAADWQLTLASVKLLQGRLRLQDDKQAGDAVVQADRIQLQLQNLAWPLAAAPVPVKLSLNLARERAPARPAADARKAPARAPGSLSWQGQILPKAGGASGKLLAEALPLHLVDPYLDPAWGLQLRRAELGLKGEFTVVRQGEGWQAGWNGDAQLARVRLNQAHWQDGRRVVGNELLGWQTLDLGGLAVQSQPGSPMQIALARAVLDDSYMQLNVDEQGNFNIRDLGGRDGAAVPAAAAASGIVLVAATPASAPAPAAAPPAVELTVGEIRFSKGEVDFSDRFIRPNYSAHLTELEGSLGSFATAKPTLAPLSLRGKVQGTGDLLIEGRLNPVGSPLTMDIRARATDIELTPLSPYAAKYAGYVIERGKLSTQVEYRIDASGQLQASNRITLNQLTFGDRVDSPDATSLPVRLAVALLTDSDGVIDVELPISGSINDPDFSIGGLVWKLIGNLLKKAVTAPFALFSGGGGQTDISQAGFAPGLAVPLDAEQLDKLARMLSERPGLALTITGWANAAADSPVLLQRQAQAAGERRRPQRQAPKVVAVSAAAASAPGSASPELLTRLADERASAVRDALIARGIANSRLFMAAPRLDAADGKDAKPRAELALEVR